MGSVFLTILIAFVFFFICLALLGIGLLLTGKPKARIGMCGRIPTLKKGKNGCGEQFSCGLCGRGEKEQNHEESKKIEE